MKIQGSAPFDNLLNKEMTRKQFLVVMGTALLSLTGVPAFMGVLMRHSTPPEIDGFGSGDFGGDDVKPINFV